MGKDMYIATSPSDVLSVYKEPRKLDMNPIIAKIMRDFNCSTFLLVLFLVMMMPQMFPQQARWLDGS